MRKIDLKWQINMQRSVFIVLDMINLNHSFECCIMKYSWIELTRVFFHYTRLLCSERENVCISWSCSHVICYIFGNGIGEFILRVSNGKHECFLCRFAFFLSHSISHHIDSCSRRVYIVYLEPKPFTYWKTHLVEYNKNKSELPWCEWSRTAFVHMHNNWPKYT